MTRKVVDVVEAGTVVVVDEARTTALRVVVVDASVEEVDAAGGAEELVVDGLSTGASVVEGLPAAVATFTPWLADEQPAKSAEAAQSITIAAHRPVTRQRFIGT